MTTPSARLPTTLPAEFRAIPDLIHEHALAAPARRALVVCAGDDHRAIDYATLDSRMDRVAATLQRDGLRSGDAIAICATSSIDYAAVFLGALRAGVVVAPLAPGSTPDALARMLADAGARLLFTDAAAADTVGEPRAPARFPASRSMAPPPASRWNPGSPRPARSPRPSPCSPRRHSTSSIRPAPPARPRGSCSRTACAGRT